MKPLVLLTIIGTALTVTLTSGLALGEPIKSKATKPRQGPLAPVVATPMRTFLLGKGALGYRSGASLVQFSPDGKTLATGGENCRLQLWDVRNNRELKLLDHSFDSIYALEFSPDGRWIAIGSSELIGVTLWDSKTGHLLRTLKQPFPKSKGAHVFNIAFTPDNRKLIANTGGKYQIWDLTKGRLLREIAPRNQNHGLALSPDGQTFAGGFFRDKMALEDRARIGLQIWDVNTGRLTRTFNQGGWPLHFSPDGKQLLLRRTGPQIASTLGQIYLGSGELWTRTQVKITANGDADPVAFSPNGKTIAVGHDNGRISIFNNRHSQRSYLPELQNLSQGKSYILALGFSKDGKLLATSNDTGQVALWRVRRGA